MPSRRWHDQAQCTHSFGPVPPLLRRCDRAINCGGAHPRPDLPARTQCPLRRPARAGVDDGTGTVSSHLWSSFLSDTCIVMYRDVSKHVFRERTLNTSRYKRDTCIAPTTTPIQPPIHHDTSIAIHLCGQRRVEWERPNSVSWSWGPVTCGQRMDPEVKAHLLVRQEHVSTPAHLILPSAIPVGHNSGRRGDDQPARHERKGPQGGARDMHDHCMAMQEILWRGV